MSSFEPGGRRFESVRAHHKINALHTISILVLAMSDD